VLNRKFVSGKKNPEYLRWPFEYSMRKKISLERDAIAVDFEIKNESQYQMPYQFGWHPAFRGNEGTFRVGEKDYSMRDVSEKGNDALRIDNAKRILYFDESTERAVEMKTCGFGNFMLWSLGGMFCIEPVTHLPGNNSFRNLPSGQEAQFSVNVRIGDL
jgi:galactose mutarotase-like enzyme